MFNQCPVHSSSIATKRSTCKDLQSSKDVSSCIHDSASLDRAASALDLNRSFPSDGLAGATFSRRATPGKTCLLSVYSRQVLMPLNGKMLDAKSVRHRRCWSLYWDVMFEVLWKSLLLLICLFLCDTVVGSEIPKANHQLPTSTGDRRISAINSRSASESLRAFGQIGGSRGDSDMAGMFMEMCRY